MESGLARLGEGFGGLIGRLPVLTRNFLENIGVQSRAEEMLGKLTNRTGLLGISIDGLGGKTQVFGGRWRDVMTDARVSAEEAGRGFGQIFGVSIPASWQNMLGGMRGGWSDAWTGMKQVFHGIINRIVNGLNNMIGGLNRFRVDMPGWLGGGSFGFNIPRIPNVPALARGGIVDAPTLALVGERGREAVLPLENNTGWMADLANTLAEVLVANQVFNGSRGEARVSLHIDGRKLAEGLIDDLDQAAERRDMVVSWV